MTRKTTNSTRSARQQAPQPETTGIPSRTTSPIKKDKHYGKASASKRTKVQNNSENPEQMDFEETTETNENLTGLPLEEHIVQETYGVSSKSAVSQGQENSSTSERDASDQQSRDSEMSETIEQRNVDDQMQEDVNQSYTEINKKQTIVLGMLWTAIKGKDIHQKFNSLGKVINEHDPNLMKPVNQYVQRMYKKTKYLAIHVDTPSAAEALCKIEFKHKVDEETEDTIYLQPWSNIRQIPTEKEQDAKNSCTIQVIDIPLDHKIYNAALLRNTFARYGTITDIKMRTRGAFQQAFITYDKDEKLNQFYEEQWSEFLLRESVRVLPLNLTDEQRQLRREFCCKLSGLPPKFKPKDAHQLLKKIKAKTCFVPRNPKTYNPLNFAYVSFRNEEDLTAAINEIFVFEDKELFWSEESTKTCHICGDPSHLAAECTHKGENRKNNKDDKNAKFQHLYKRFRPAQHRRDPNKANNNKRNKNSYAEAAKKAVNGSPTNQQQYRPWNKRNIGQPKMGTLAGGSMHEPNQPPNETNLLAALQEIKVTLKKFAAEHEKLKKDMAAIGKAIQNKPKSRPAPVLNIPSNAKNTEDIAVRFDKNKRNLSEVESSDSELEEQVTTLKKQVESQDTYLQKIMNTVESFAGKLQGALGGASSSNSNNDNMDEDEHITI